MAHCGSSRTAPRNGPFSSPGVARVGLFARQNRTSTFRFGRNSLRNIGGPGEIRTQRRTLGPATHHGSGWLRSPDPILGLALRGWRPSLRPRNGGRLPVLHASPRGLLRSRHRVQHLDDSFHRCRRAISAVAGQGCDLRASEPSSQGGWPASPGPVVATELH